VNSKRLDMPLIERSASTMRPIPQTAWWLQSSKRAETGRGLRVAEVEVKIAEHDATPTPRFELRSPSLTALGDDLSAVWSAPTTDARLKKRIARTGIQEVIADIDADAGEIVPLVHWVGGTHTELRLPRRRRRQHNSTAPDIIEAVRQLVLIANDDLIAGLLNRNKLTAGHGKPLDARARNLPALASQDPSAPRSRKRDRALAKSYQGRRVSWDQRQHTPHCRRKRRDRSPLSASRGPRESSAAPA
jgi:hypothetical protein